MTRILRVASFVMLFAASVFVGSAKAMPELCSQAQEYCEEQIKGFVCLINWGYCSSEGWVVQDYMCNSEQYCHLGEPLYWGTCALDPGFSC
jgi:hypothetical protein